MDILWLIVIVLIILWVGGFALSIGGSLIHLLLIVIVLVVAYKLITGRRL